MNILINIMKFYNPNKVCEGKHSDKILAHENLLSAINIIFPKDSDKSHIYMEKVLNLIL